MAITVIPTVSDVPFYEFEVELDGTEFKLEFRFNDRDDAWYMSMLDIDDVLLRGSIRIVLSWDLLRLWAEATRPDGEIISVNQGKILAPPTLNQLSEEVVLSYIDAADVALIAAEIAALG